MRTIRIFSRITQIARIHATCWRAKKTRMERSPPRRLPGTVSRRPDRRETSKYGLCPSRHAGHVFTIRFRQTAERCRRRRVFLAGRILSYPIYSVYAYYALSRSPLKVPKADPVDETRHATLCSENRGRKSKTDWPDSVRCKRVKNDLETNDRVWMFFNPHWFECFLEFDF